MKWRVQVALVLRSLHLHDSNPTLQGVACDTLGNLLQEQSNTEQFLRLGGVDAVLHVINANMAHTRVMEAACFLLGNVASSEEGLKHIAKHGGGTVALTVIKSHLQDAELLREILFLVSNMGQSSQLQADLVRAGAVEAVIQVMETHGTSSEIMAMGCSALDNLIGTSEGDVAAHKQQPPVSKGAFEACVRALTKHSSDPSVVRRSAGAIATMGAIQPRSPLLVANAELIDALAKGGRSMMMTGKQDAQALVQVLRALEVVADYPENRAFLICPGGPVSLAVSISQSANARPAPVARGLAFVAKLCESAHQRSKAGQGQQEGQVSEEHGLEMVVKSLATFWNHPSVVIPACTIIAAMAKGVLVWACGRVGVWACGCGCVGVGVWCGRVNVPRAIFISSRACVY